MKKRKLDTVRQRRKRAVADTLASRRYYWTLPDGRIAAVRDDETRDALCRQFEAEVFGAMR